MLRFALPVFIAKALLPEVSIDAAPSNDSVPASDSIVPASNVSVAVPASSVRLLLPLVSIVEAALNESVVAATANACQLSPIESA